MRNFLFGLIWGMVIVTAKWASAQPARTPMPPPGCIHTVRVNFCDGTMFEVTCPAAAPLALPLVKGGGR